MPKKSTPDSLRSRLDDLRLIYTPFSLDFASFIVLLTVCYR